MDDSQRKGINFDLDTKILQKNYLNGDWHNAYNDIKIFFESNGFEHIQGSGYHSIKPVSELNAMGVIYKLIKTYPWIKNCVKVCTIADIPETYDITNVFNAKNDISLARARNYRKNKSKDIER